MKSTLLKFAFLFIAASCICGMCNKDSEDEVPTKTYLISAGNWYFTAYTAIDYDGNGTKETDLLSAMEPCQRDNFYVFRADGTGEFNYGIQKCGTEPQSLPYKWSFIENETKIKLDNGNTYLIIVLNENKLEMVLGSQRLTFSH